MDREQRLALSNAEIAEAYVAYYLRRGRPTREQDFKIDDDDADWWPVGVVMDLEFDDPIRALEIVFLVARATPDDWVLEVLGAGPLETLLAHDATLLDAVALEVRSNLNLKEALQAIWQNSMSDETFRAVQQLAGALPAD